MGRYSPNIQPLALETEYALVFSCLEGLAVCGATKAIFQRFVNGELTIKELSTAIDEYLSLNAGSSPPQC